MKVISIANAKGGVGKTTITVNLAFELQYLGYVVLLIDLDDQCDLTKIYRPKGDTTPDILDVLEGRHPMTEAYVNTATNLYLIPGSTDLAHFSFTHKEQILKEYLKDDAFNEVDFVLLDHPPNLNEATLTGFTASDAVIIVTDPEAFGVQNLDKMLDNVDHIQQTMNPDLTILGIVVNKIDRRRKLTQSMLNQLKTNFGDSLFDSWISNDTAIPTSLYEGKPVRQIHWRSRTVKQLNALTLEFLERME